MIDMQPFVEGCSKMGIRLHEDHLIMFQDYLLLLLEWNQKFNLTAIREPDEILVQHFLDSISVILAYSDGMETPSSILDMGSGAGFPGIPLKILYPQAKITLVDSVQKKVGFLNEVIRQLGLVEAVAIHARAEDLARDRSHRERYDLVVSRAVAEYRVLAEYCLPFVKKGGYFIAHKGPGAADELEKAQKALGLLGGKLVEKKRMEIPFSDKTHKLVVVKKVESSPLKYPRHASKLKKDPL